MFIYRHIVHVMLIYIFFIIIVCIVAVIALSPAPFSFSRGYGGERGEEDSSFRRLVVSSRASLLSKPLYQCLRAQVHLLLLLFSFFLLFCNKF